MTERMEHLVGLYRLRQLWIELQSLKPDENGIIHFNFEQWKRIHNIEPGATAPE